MSKQNKVDKQLDDRILSQELDEIYGEKITEIAYHHPLQFTDKYAQQVNSWDVKQKLVHLTDMIRISPHEANTLVYETLGNQGIVTLDTNVDLNQSYDVEEIDFEFSAKMLFLRTKDHTYLILAGPRNNDYLWSPKEFETLENELGMVRSGSLRVYQLPVDALQKFQEEGFPVVEKYYGDRKEIHRFFTKVDGENELAYMFTEKLK